MEICELTQFCIGFESFYLAPQFFSLIPPAFRCTFHFEHFQKFRRNNDFPNVQNFTAIEFRFISL